MANVSASRPPVHSGSADRWPARSDRWRWELGPAPEDSTDYSPAEPTDDEGHRQLLADDHETGHHADGPSPEEGARLTLDELMDRRAEESALMDALERGHLLAELGGFLALWAWVLGSAAAAILAAPGAVAAALG